MRNGWDSFRGQHISIQFLAVLVGLLAALLLASEAGWTIAAGGTASPAAAPAPVTRPSTTPPATQPAQSTPTKTKHAGTAAPKAKAGPHYLCIYPGIGARHMISALPGGVTKANWAAACQATDGSPVTRVSASLFRQPSTHQLFRLQHAGGGNFYVRLARS